MLMKGELHKAPVKNPGKILDLGTGTGIWALDIAEYVNRIPTITLFTNYEQEIPTGTSDSE